MGLVFSWRNPEILLSLFAGCQFSVFHPDFVRLRAREITCLSVSGSSSVVGMWISVWFANSGAASIADCRMCKQYSFQLMPERLASMSSASRSSSVTVTLKFTFPLPIECVVGCMIHSDLK